MECRDKKCRWHKGHFVQWWHFECLLELSSLIVFGGGHAHVRENGARLLRYFFFHKEIIFCVLSKLAIRRAGQLVEICYPFFVFVL